MTPEMKALADQHRINWDMIDEEAVAMAALALLYLGREGLYQTWKGYDWSVLDKLHAMGLIDDARNTRKSLYLTDEGLEKGKAAVATLFQRRS
jgi:hypothetical protein